VAVGKTRDLLEEQLGDFAFEQSIAVLAKGRRAPDLVVEAVARARLVAAAVRCDDARAAAERLIGDGPRC